jgi:hypothetical protein
MYPLTTTRPQPQLCVCPVSRWPGNLHFRKNMITVWGCKNWAVVSHMPRQWPPWFSLHTFCVQPARLAGSAWFPPHKVCQTFNRLRNWTVVSCQGWPGLQGFQWLMKHFHQPEILQEFLLSAAKNDYGFKVKWTSVIPVKKGPIFVAGLTRSLLLIT